MFVCVCVCVCIHVSFATKCVGLPHANTTATTKNHICKYMHTHMYKRFFCIYVAMCQINIKAIYLHNYIPNVLNQQVYSAIDAISTHPTHTNAQTHNIFIKLMLTASVSIYVCIYTYILVLLRATVQWKIASEL